MFKSFPAISGFEELFCERRNSEVPRTLFSPSQLDHLAFFLLQFDSAIEKPSKRIH
ncbi:expressed protein [Arabidopsis lyrata subsp. lyrata]|uniref:Expressed protein n=1 Tax=Arabidopsis lyrata subsp. lyrata TaxID=81972 RepID=D7LFI1_ARALL|nr:expressed protein [Arabidopsis lyrata subsp. lyrata]